MKQASCPQRELYAYAKERDAETAGKLNALIELMNHRPSRARKPSVFET